MPIEVGIGRMGVLWWRDRRLPEDSCRNCRYDLTGNESGVCPECGSPVKEDATPMRNDVSRRTEP